MALDEIRTRICGDHGAPHVALLHGGPGAPGTMAPVARELADGFRVLEPLQRASGTTMLSVAQHVEDMAAVLPDRTALVGSSWGAMLALSYAAAHPERVRGLVLVGCGTYDTVSRDAYRAAMNARLGPEGLAEIDALRARREGVTDPDKCERLFDAIGHLFTVAQCYDPLTTDFETVATDAQGHEETWNDVLRLQAEGVEPAAFTAIDAPVLMIHGAEDPHPGRSTYETLQAAIPQLDYVEFERCGHMPWAERHARRPFFELLRAWLHAMVMA